MATAQTMSPSPDGHIPKLSPALNALKSPTLVTVSAPENEVEQDMNSNLLKSNDDLKSLESTLAQKHKLSVRTKKRKRRHSFNFNEATCNNRGGKSRRNSAQFRKNSKSSMLPNKFLLGGNIADPLNLNSMLDENVNKELNAVTPSSSPLPPRNAVVDVVVPSDMRDPLGLNTSSDIEPLSGVQDGGANLNKKRKRKRRRKSNLKPGPNGYDEKTSASDDQKEGPSDLQTTPEPKVTKKRPTSMVIQPTQSQGYRQQGQGKSNDPIVSPVVPQDARRRRNLLSLKTRRRHKFNAARALAPEIESQSGEKSRAESEKNEEKRLPAPRRRRTCSENIVSSFPANNCEDIDVIIKSCFNSKLFKFDVESKTNALQEAKEGSETTNLKNPNEIKSKKVNDVELSINPESTSPIKKQKTAEIQKEKCPSKHVKKNKNTPSFKPSSAKYQYGNYSQYYGYRNNTKFHDQRLGSFKKDWFKDRDVLDVGCNSGHLTLLIARDFAPRKIVGIDIDETLVHCARTNIRHYVTGTKSTTPKFPVSMAVSLGPLSAPPIECSLDQPHSFPYNVNFFHGNYVPARDDVLKFQEPEYDVIMCLSVSKWIHLNWGDDGIKRMFQRVFKQLRPGGKFILEPQPWKSYNKKKNLTERIYTNYNSIKLKPPAFPTYLRDEVGFKKVEYLETPHNDAKGFERPIHIYYKPE